MCGRIVRTLADGPVKYAGPVEQHLDRAQGCEGTAAAHPTVSPYQAAHTEWSLRGTVEAMSARPMFMDGPLAACELQMRVEKDADGWESPIEVIGDGVPRRYVWTGDVSVGEPEGGRPMYRYDGDVGVIGT